MPICSHCRGNHLTTDCPCNRREDHDHDEGPSSAGAGFNGGWSGRRDGRTGGAGALVAWNGWLRSKMLLLSRYSFCLKSPNSLHPLAVHFLPLLLIYSYIYLHFYSSHIFDLSYSYLFIFRLIPHIYRSIAGANAHSTYLSRIIVLLWAHICVYFSLIHVVILVYKILLRKFCIKSKSVMGQNYAVYLNFYEFFSKNFETNSFMLFISQKKTQN